MPEGPFANPREIVMSSLKIAALALFAGMIAGPVFAQDTGGYPPGMSVTEIEAREQAETARLNNAVLERDAQIVASNQAAEAEFAQDQAAFAAAQAEHDRAQAQYEAELAAAQAEQARYEAEMARWRARTGRPN